LKTLTFRSGRDLATSLAVSIALFGLGGGNVNADGNETLGFPKNFVVQPGSNVVTAGTGLFETGKGDIKVNLPQGAAVKQVILHWSQRGGTTIADSLLVNNKTVTGTIIGSGKPAGLNPPGYSFRADITDLGVVYPGTNTLKLSGVNVQGNVLQGASVTVVYSAATDVQYTGSAVAVSAKIATTTTNLGATGNLPPAGGALKPAPLVNVKVPGLLTSSTIASSTTGTVGTAGTTVSKSKVEGLGLNLGTALTLKARVLESSAQATCTAKGAVVSGKSNFLGLALNGAAKAVSFARNTTLLNLLGLVKVVANEQTQTGSGNSKAITVNALHISVPGLNLLGVKPNDIVIASATAGVSCVAPSPSEISLRDGWDFAYIWPDNSKSFSTVRQTFSINPVPFDRVAQFHVFVADAEAAKPDFVRTYRNGALVATLYDTFNASAGTGWDNNVVTVPVPAGTSSVGIDLGSRKLTGGLADSLYWVGAVLDLPSELPANVYSGRATVVRANVDGLADVALADTGALPSAGGDLDATLSKVNVPLLLSATTAKATTVGAGNKSTGAAAVEKLILALPGITVKADVLKSSAGATCGIDKLASVYGGSTLANVTVNGKAITNLKVNAVVDLGVAKIYINERKASASGHYGAITANALRVNVPNPVTGLLGTDLVNVVVGHSHADIYCN